MTVKPSDPSSVALATYRLAARVMHRVPFLTGKVGRGVAGRRGAAERWVQWARAARGAAPLVWVHAASVGEALAIEPVLARLRCLHRDLQMIHTFTSPSVGACPPSSQVAHRDFAPLDEPRHVDAALAALRPDLLVCSRGDLWPELILGAARHRVPVAVSGATVRPRSARLRTPLVGLLRSVCHQVSWLGAVSPAHAERWRRLGVPASRVEVTGDPRHAHVVERIPSLAGLAPVVDWAAGGHVLVAGSVHAEDLPVVLAAAACVLARHERARLVIVPHEPTTVALRGVGAAAARQRLACGFWEPGGGTLPRDQVIAVGGVGRLADLYAMAQVAYVGGGFRTGQLHAVSEPAAWTLPVVVGPATEHEEDVDALVHAGGACRLPEVDSAEALRHLWERWVEEPAAAARAGLAARAMLRPEAAARTAARLADILRARSPLHT